MVTLPAHCSPPPPSSRWWERRARWVYDALLTGQLRDHDVSDDRRYAVALEAIGTVDLPDGVVVAADPYVMDDAQPFTQHLAVDRVEVVAARATLDEGHDRVAALLLLCGARPVVDWVMATVPGQELATLGEQKEGYVGDGDGVDAGTGSFGSPDAMRVTARVLQEDGGMLEDPVSSALFADGLGTRSAVVVAPEPGATAVAVCSSGWGDGAYPTWMGVDDHGDVMVVVTDFLLTADPHRSALPSGPPQPAQPAPSRRPDVETVELVGGVEKRALVLVDDDGRWPARYAVHEQRLRAALGSTAVDVEHIGSTSVPGLAAKPILDIQVTVEDITAEEDYLEPLLAAGYLLRVREPGHRLVRTPARDVHVHLHQVGDQALTRRRSLRDHLRRDAGDRDLYEGTKRELTQRDWPDMNAYADAKTQVITAITQRAHRSPP